MRVRENCEKAIDKMRGREVRKGERARKRKEVIRERERKE